MNTTLTKNEQLIGLLTGVWSTEATAAFRTSNPRDLLTIKRADVLDYLNENPQLARGYLKKWEAVRPAADINVVWAEEGGYKVAWMTWEGKPWAIEKFRDLNEAIAEHICRHSGVKD